jgi:phage baseplate assembly protein W
MAYQYFSDLDLRFNIHPVTKDLVLSSDEQAISRSIKNLVLTNHYERLMQSSIGSNVSGMLFELITPLTASQVQREIYDVITAFEPRAINVIVSVTAIPEQNALNANIQYYIENTPIPIVVDILLERIR